MMKKKWCVYFVALIALAALPAMLISWVPARGVRTAAVRGLAAAQDAARGIAAAQDAAALLQKVRDRLDRVNDYQATGIMKTNVSFLKVPEAQVTVYFKKPDKLKIKNDKGISLVPKGAVTISLNNLLKGGYTVLDAGADTTGGYKVRAIKLLPLDENADLVLATLYIDEARLLVLKARTTTRENGTYEVTMDYGKYAAYALPDRVVFLFNIKDYKLPKGVTFDYDDGSARKQAPPAGGKGKVEINYRSYAINRGIPDAEFQ
jgi:outer membrane lipoprotein-sorting protein